jgi:hypothetical protein
MTGYAVDAPSGSLWCIEGRAAPAPIFARLERGLLDLVVKPEPDLRGSMFSTQAEELGQSRLTERYVGLYSFQACDLEEERLGLAGAPVLFPNRKRSFKSSS